MPDASACARAAAAELQGWVYVTNQLLLESARNTVAQVEEPSRRASLNAEYVEGLTKLFYSHAAAVTSLLFLSAAKSTSSAVVLDEEHEKKWEIERERVVAEVQELTRQKQALEQEVERLQKEEQRVGKAVSVARADADALRREVEREQKALETLRREMQEESVRQREEHEHQMFNARQELRQTQEEFAAEGRRLQKVRQQLRSLADVLAELRDGDGDGDERVLHEEPSESLRQLLEEFVAYAEVTQRTQQELQEELVALREQMAAEEPVASRSRAQTLYQRILPPPAVNPVALTLQSVREQVRELRPQAAGTPCGVVDTPRIQNRQWQQHSCRSHIKGETSFTASPVSQCQTPQTWLPNGVSSNLIAWREKMALLKAELHDLRREIEN
ncbi:hypothetical protein C3747_284g30 [Trypanosoma cruzi]|uniref:Uncharacterized protein n=1 Tax=Trypanosoma cruzi TaxID=5693 RepID=A0A2V2VC52_TRYCR|nr:hypothetical protein C3747_284g30 [Trypanosoma cruzi]RNC54725.1 hypothetical protein TcCL_ESM07827 [Trypanosoma cruzi]